MSSLAVDEGTDRGDGWWYERTYAAHRRTVYRLAAAALSDHHAAEDVVQEVFIAVWRKLPERVRGSEEQLGAWLSTTTRREVARCVRRRLELTSPEACVAREQDGELDERIELAGGWPSDPVVAEVLDELPIRQRQALVLRFTLDFSRDETGLVIGCSRKAVKDLENQAFATLGERLAARGWASVREVSPHRQSMWTRVRRLPVLRARKWALAQPARGGDSIVEHQPADLWRNVGSTRRVEVHSRQPAGGSDCSCGCLPASQRTATRRAVTALGHEAVGSLDTIELRGVPGVIAGGASFSGSIPREVRSALGSGIVLDQ
jgi:RNA polymerase sigma-70 factor (ECF subfamily)